ncbi:MAG: hypothetical protein ACWGOX_05705 [Desulforhopalus sp.]
MTRGQKRELLSKWRFYNPRKKKEIIDEYLASNDGLCCQETFLRFIAEKFKADSLSRH